MRAAMVLAWLATLVTALLSWPRPRPPIPRTRAIPDQLVKDPVCQTYVVRSRAVTRTLGGQPRYFCSVRCAERFALGSV